MKHGIAHMARLGLVIPLLSIARFADGQDNTLPASRGENGYAHDGIPMPMALSKDVEIRQAVACAEAAEVGVVAQPADSFLVYSNTRGRYVFGPAGSAATAIIADDVTITVLADCILDRYVIRVTGDCANAGQTEPFSVTTALYKVCPGATPHPTAIAGTTCSFSDLTGTGIHELACPATTDVQLPDNFYVAVKFSRDNCGVVVGAPPELGFSADRFDTLGSPCTASLGGYPDHPHASFWTQVYTRQDCAKSFVGYKNSNHAGNFYTPGAGIWFADDIKLGVPECNLIAYEVALKGFGLVKFDLRTFLSNSNPDTGGVIPGTVRTYLSLVNKSQVARFAIDPPIPLPRNFYITFKTSSALPGPIFTNMPAALGSTEDLFCVYRDGEWQCGPYSPQTYAAFDVTIICEGEPPLGACCDMINVDGQGEAVCSELPQMNCGFLDLWREGEVCEDVCDGGTNDGQPCTRQADCPGYSCVGGTNAGNPCVLISDCPGGFCRRARCPGPFAFPCGQSACCTHDDYCFNYTENECNARPPLDKPRLYEPGGFCSYAGYQCPWGACLGREGLCSLPHPWTGCEDPYCCTGVCRVDSFCCLVEWDEQCANNTFRYCTSPPPNDECWDPDQDKGARTIAIPSSTESDNLHATENISDPGFCCHKEDPGAIGYGTVWYKFVATDTSAAVRTCYSNPPASDSLISVYESADPDLGTCERGADCSVAAQDCTDRSDCVPDEQYTCGHLNLIGCSDDVQGCSGSNKNSSLCLTGLTVGQTYYVLVASKPDIDPGDYPQLVYRLDVSSPCTPDKPPIPNDYCQDAKELPGEGHVVEPFDLSGGGFNAPATFHCPGEPCVDPFMQNDVWYTWTSPCNGYARITTCDPVLDPEDQTPTSMVVYGACECPVPPGVPRGCSIGELGPCGLAAAVEFDAFEGSCYLIRLGGYLGDTPAGELKLNIACVGCDDDADCNDDNVCTDDVCVAGACQNTHNTAGCDDGLFCNGADTCSGGACALHAGDPCAPASCDEQNDRCLSCPPGTVTFIDPPGDVIDARQPYLPHDSTARQGIISLTVHGPEGIDNVHCWTLCETRVDDTRNEIKNIVDNGHGTFTVDLIRTISIGAVTTLTYRDDNGTPSRGVFTSHPANADGDNVSGPVDILAIIDIINRMREASWGNLSCDMNHSGVCEPADILRLIDLLNGADAFDPWLGQPLPECGMCCP